MPKKQFKISYNTGGKTKSLIVSSAKERDTMLSFMKQRKDKDGYRNVKVVEYKPVKK